MCKAVSEEHTDKWQSSVINAIIQVHEKRRKQYLLVNMRDERWLHKGNIWARSSKLYRNILGYGNMVFNGIEASKSMPLNYTFVH